MPAISATGSGAAAKSFVARTFGWMFIGLGLSAVVAAWFAANGDTVAYFEDHLGVFVGLLVAEFALILAIGLGIGRIGAQAATFLYCLWSGVNGVLLSVVFSAYTSAEIAPAFAASAGMFGTAALYGYLTEQDLGSLRGLLVMGLSGLILATFINVFVASSGLYWLTTFAGIAIFLAMAAYTVQGIEQMGAERSGSEAENAAIFGALLLSLEFLNVFLYVLRFFQSSR